MVILEMLTFSLISYSYCSISSKFTLDSNLIMNSTLTSYKFTETHTIIIKDNNSHQCRLATLGNPCNNNKHKDTLSLCNLNNLIDSLQLIRVSQHTLRQ